MTTPPLDLDALDELARAPGRRTWWDEHELGTRPFYSHDDARYIAAVSPDVVLELVARVRKAEHEANQYNELLVETAEKLGDAEARLAEAVGVVRECEWGSFTYRDERMPNHPVSECPSCGASFLDRVHDEGCALAKVLRGGGDGK